MIKLDENKLPDLEWRIGKDEKMKLSLTGATTSNGVEFVDMANSKLVTGVSERTSWRKIKKLKASNGNKEYCLPQYMEVQGKYYVSKYLYPQKKKIRKEKINEEYIKWLRTLHWDIAGCVRYKEDISYKAITRRIRALFDLLDDDHNGVPVIFFVLHKNPDNPLSYHAHFVISYENKFELKWMKKMVTTLLMYDGRFSKPETWLRKYDPKKRYLEYMLNKVAIDDDMHDIYHNKKINS